MTSSGSRILSVVFLFLLALALSTGALAQLTHSRDILAGLSSENPLARREALQYLPVGLEARPDAERRELLSGLVKTLEDKDSEVAGTAGRTLELLLGQGLSASSGLREPNLYLTDLINATALGLEGFSGRSRAETALMNTIEKLEDEGDRDAYRRLNLLLKGIARLNVSLGADDSLEDALEKVAEIFGKALNSYNSRERDRGMQGIRVALDTFMDYAGEGNLWNRKRAEKFTEETMAVIEKALGSGNSRVRLDAAKLGRELLDRAQRLKMTRSADRLRREVVKSLEEMLADSSPEIRAESAEKLGLVGGKESVPALEKTLADKDRKVSEASAEAIKKITGKKPEVGKKGK
jgi:HEAT repeat protein